MSTHASPNGSSRGVGSVAVDGDVLALQSYLDRWRGREAELADDSQPAMTARTTRTTWHERRFRPCRSGPEGVGRATGHEHTANAVEPPVGNFW
ncbi:hypothetical protein K8369_37425 [Streptomyces sp. PSKA30]|nr:hypothetical protein [Streptomyces sp. PSKA30]